MGLSLNLSMYQWVMEAEAKYPLHNGQPGHQVRMASMQQARRLRAAVIADFKPDLQCQKAVKETWCALRQIRRIVGFGGPNFLRCSWHVWDLRYNVKMLEQFHRDLTCLFGRLGHMGNEQGPKEFCFTPWKDVGRGVAWYRLSS